MKYQVSKTTSAQGATYRLTPIEAEPCRGSFEADVLEDLSAALEYLAALMEREGGEIG